MAGKFKADVYGSIAAFQDAIKDFHLKGKYYRPVFQGRGLDFDGFRAYSPGDDASLIDWKASVKANKTLVKQYVEEKGFRSLFVIDVSGSMVFGSGKKLKCEYVAEMAASLADLMLRSGDRVGFVLYNHGIVKFLPPGGRRDVFYELIDSLLEPENYDGLGNLEDCLDYLNDSIGGSVAALVIISDFIKFNKEIEEKIRRLGTRFEVMAIRVRDKMDKELPKISGEFVLEDPVSNQQITVNPKIAGNFYKEHVRKQDLIVKETFENSGIDFLDISTSEDFIFPLSLFLKERAGGK